MKRALAVVAIAALALAGSGCNWFKSMGRKDNVEPPTPLLEFAPTLQVERLWSASVGDGAGLSGARMTPAVGADGRVYAVSIDGSIEAFDGASGRSAWRKRLGGSRGFLWKRGEHSMRWSGGPAIDGDLLVVGGLDGRWRRTLADAHRVGSDLDARDRRRPRGGARQRWPAAGAGCQ